MQGFNRQVGPQAARDSWAMMKHVAKNPVAAVRQGGKEVFHGGVGKFWGGLMVLDAAHSALPAGYTGSKTKDFIKSQWGDEALKQYLDTKQKATLYERGGVGERLGNLAASTASWLALDSRRPQTKRIAETAARLRKNVPMRGKGIGMVPWMGLQLAAGYVGGKAGRLFDRAVGTRRPGDEEGRAAQQQLAAMQAEIGYRKKELSSMKANPSS